MRTISAFANRAFFFLFVGTMLACAVPWSFREPGLITLIVWGSAVLCLAIALVLLAITVLMIDIDIRIDENVEKYQRTST